MKIICIGRNYADHAAEMGSSVPSEPLVFMKPPSALMIGNKPLYYPAFTENLHYEGELVLKVCKNGRHVQPEHARSYYDQVAFGIDFTARDLQARCKEKGHPWEIAKGFDNSAAVSDFVSLENYNVDEIAFETFLNGEQVQSGNTQDLIFSFDTLICHISKYFKLQQGDIIFTGTPAGVGPVKIGDLVEGYIEGKKMMYCEIR